MNRGLVCNRTSYSLANCYKGDSDTTHHTYLDTTGRPVVVITNKGVLTESHIQNFQLQFKYVLNVDQLFWFYVTKTNFVDRFSHSSMFMEPLLLVTAFLLFFLLSIIYVRLDFSITVDEGAEARMKVQKTSRSTS